MKKKFIKKRLKPEALWMGVGLRAVLISLATSSEKAFSIYYAI